ncbi:MAG: VWA domain-containing protein [Thiohalomonadales bacterium]
MHLRLLHILLLSIVTGLMIPIASYADKQGSDVVLLMDSSGSMKHTDPNTLRAPAAKLFVSLLGKTDRASIVSFSDNGYPVAYLTKATGERNRKILFSAIDKISTRGVYTNLAGAIETAISVLQRNKQQGRKQMIVLMSDGKMDLGDKAKNTELTNELLNKHLPALTKLGITLNTIAFTQQSDQALMQQLATKSGGTYFLAKTDKSLRQVYTSIFEQSKVPNQVPFDDNKFVIDKSVSETTIVGSKKSKRSNLTLLSPNGDRYNKDSTKKSIKWFVSDTFDIITVKNPTAGEWRLQSSDGDNKAYIVSDLQLFIEYEPKNPIIGAGVVIKSWLQSGTKIITSPEILEKITTSLAALTPEGVTHQLQMEPYSLYKDEPSSVGIYASHIAFPSAGRFQISIAFKANTFERKKVTLVDIQASVITEEPNVEPVNPPVVSEPITAPITAETTSAHAEENNPAITTQVETTGQKLEKPKNSGLQLPALPDFTPQNSNDHVEEAGATHIDVDSHEEASTHQDEHSESSSSDSNDASETESAAEHETQGKAHGDKSTLKEDALPEEDGGGLLTAIIAFVGINLFLIIIGVGGYFLYKRHKAKSSTDSDDDLDDDENIESAQEDDDNPAESNQKAA